jgi:hypothetical protein
MKKLRRAQKGKETPKGTALNETPDFMLSEQGLIAKYGEQKQKAPSNIPPEAVADPQLARRLMEQGTISEAPSRYDNFLPRVGLNPNFLGQGESGTLNPFTLDAAGGWTEALGMHNPQTFNVPRLDAETGEVINEEYKTSLMNELNRTGVEPTFTFTSAGGPGAGFRGYFPYSDPLGIGLELDLDPTGPGGGLLINTANLRNYGNSLADATGTDVTRDMNLPPGFLYTGIEMAGNMRTPFVGATVSAHDTQQLQTWLGRADNEQIEEVTRGGMHAMGPGLYSWNHGSKFRGGLKVHNPFDVMGKPWIETPGLFGKTGLHNPVSGTGVGVGGRSGLRGGNLVPHVELGPLEQGFRGGFADIKADVLSKVDELIKTGQVVDEGGDVVVTYNAANKALSKEAAAKKIYDAVAGSIPTGKLFDKLRIPQVLDAAGEALYGTTGAGGYDKAGKTLANTLKNSKIPYGKLLNHPWLWKGLSRGLMVPDAIDIGLGALHRPGMPVSDAWSGVFGDNPNSEFMEQYGAFPRAQLFMDQGIDPVFNHKWFDNDLQKDQKLEKAIAPIIKTLQKEERYKDKSGVELRPLAIKILQDKEKAVSDASKIKRVTNPYNNGIGGYKFQGGGPNNQQTELASPSMPGVPNKTWLNLVDQLGKGETVENAEYMSTANIMSFEHGGVHWDIPEDEPTRREIRREKREDQKGMIPARFRNRGQAGLDAYRAMMQEKNSASRNPFAGLKSLFGNGRGSTQKAAENAGMKCSKTGCGAYGY